ncbi:hypothetical protein T439DRAFT_4111 [Meredithblackwellia eburnea MCA 4105]
MPFSLKNLLHKVNLNDNNNTSTNNNQASSSSSSSAAAQSANSASASSRRSREAARSIQEPAPVHYANEQVRAAQPVVSNAAATGTTATTGAGATLAMPSGPSEGSKEQAEAIVRKENELKQRRERGAYEGLPDGLTLGVKMGDGAFSNVFQATLRPNAAQLAIDPTLGKSVKVAVKCVRKYELNHSQVRILLFASYSRARIAVAAAFILRYCAIPPPPFPSRFPLGVKCVGGQALARGHQLNLKGNAKAPR